MIPVRRVDDVLLTALRIAARESRDYVVRCDLAQFVIDGHADRGIELHRPEFSGARARLKDIEILSRLRHQRPGLLPAYPALHRQTMLRAGRSRQRERLATPGMRDHIPVIGGG